MLQFFKKSGQRYKPRSSPNSPSNHSNLTKSASNAQLDDLTARLQFSPQCSLEEAEEDEICGDQTQGEITTIRSRLSKTLPEILADKGALGYFFQFLESRGCVALIKFWLEVECVREASIAQESQEVRGGGGDHTRETDNAIVSADNNDNYRCHVAVDDISSRGSEKFLDDTSYSNNDTKSNCDGTPKTSQVVKGAEESNVRSEDARQGPATTKHDALKIYKRYITKDTLGMGKIPDELRAEMEAAFFDADVRPILKCLHEAQKIVYKVLEDEHIDDFLRSDFHCKHQIDVLTSGNVQLADILYNETAFFYFMEFMEIENRRELLDFWMSIVNYKQNLIAKESSTNASEAQSDALILYDKYFSLQATMPLGFSNKIRFQVEQNICREDGEGPKPDCFDRPCQIVYNFLNKHYFGAFLSSQLYYKYLSELISTVQSSACPSLHPRLRRSGSDCSSEISAISISTQSTHTTGLEESGRSLGNTNINANMNIDTRKLYDPDSLWKRRKYSLSVGYVNDMGRFVTEIEPDPHRKYESRLSRAVKRLVNMEHDKAKEEMAWKIAEMIVREITTLTLGVSSSHLTS